MKCKTIEQLFQEVTGPAPVVSYNGQQLVRVDHFRLGDSNRVRITIEQFNNRWRQAIRLEVDGELEVSGAHSRRMVLWTDTAPKETSCVCSSRDGNLLVYNGWDSGTGKADSWLGNSAMIVEEIVHGKRYRCNDSYPDDDFTDLIFRIERILS